MNKELIIYWVRRDFRLEDNEALSRAVKDARNNKALFIPIFILEDYMCIGDPKFQFGLPSRYFLSKAIPLYSSKFKKFALLKGKPTKIFSKLSKKYDISIYVNEDVHEDFYKQVKKIKDSNINIEVFADALTISRETKTGNDKYYSVFTPFKKAVWNEFVSKSPIKKPSLDDLIYESGEMDDSLEISEKNIFKNFSDNRLLKVKNIIYDLSKLVADKTSYENWYFDEDEASKRYKKFIEHDLISYKNRRDSLELDATSRMSLALTWGLMSPRSLVHLIEKKYGETLRWDDISKSREGAIHYISELIWREFYKYLYFHHPNIMNEEFQERFRGKIDWVSDKISQERFELWIRGETGYPIVDAAMHEIAQTGYMHNRARMIVASILTKNLGVDWRYGQEYFRAMLIDLDDASNNGGWQWGASVGADPKPIRIFNPYLQSENYDSGGIYQKKYLPAHYFSNPPKPIVEHKDARVQAIKRYGLNEKKDGYARDY